MTLASTDCIICVLMSVILPGLWQNIKANLTAGPSARTIRRCLLIDWKLRSYHPAKKAKLSKKNVKDCITFCRKYKHWVKENWMKVIFSNESTFSQFKLYKTQLTFVIQRGSTQYSLHSVKGQEGAYNNSVSKLLRSWSRGHFTSSGSCQKHNHKWTRLPVNTERKTTDTWPYSAAQRFIIKRHATIQAQ